MNISTSISVKTCISRSIHISGNVSSSIGICIKISIGIGTGIIISICVSIRHFSQGRDSERNNQKWRVASVLPLPADAEIHLILLCFAFGVSAPIPKT